jgi:photosystem II stability/assembly factor-like uncharacterized protein
MIRLQSSLPSASRTSWLALVVAVPLLMFGMSLPAQEAWTAVGPAGGDARSFAADPSDSNHLYLGTTNSWVYESTNQGASWHRLAKIDRADDLVLDHILVDRVDPSKMFVAAWKLDRKDGGLWVSRNGGTSWTEVEGLRGQSIRAFAQSPSDPKVLFAGTLDGVFRSTDGGATWMLISPPGSTEIHEIESLAVDPEDPLTVYAGTWHLPWKTVDGGQSWGSIKHGIIEDSDVFSIIVDPEQTGTVFLSACSGIYKSQNGGDKFARIEGIPSTARRTRVLMQDPSNLSVVYAGTTEGLFKTLDGGKTFERVTGPDVIVNDVFVDPRDPKHVLLATDRSGVLASQDGAATFTASNEGFSGRTVGALLVDRKDTSRVYAGVINDKGYGGVFVSSHGGDDWQQVDGGLDGRDVFALAQAADGTLVAGTSHGIFVLQETPQATPPQPLEQTEAQQAPDRLSKEKSQQVEPPVSHPALKDTSFEGHIEKLNEIDPQLGLPDEKPSAWQKALSGTVVTEPQAASEAAEKAVGQSDAPPAAQEQPAVKKPSWQPRSLLVNAQVKLAAGAPPAAAKVPPARKGGAEGHRRAPAPEIEGRVNAVDVSSELWVASASTGIYTSRDQGASWQGGPVLADVDFISLAVQGDTIAAAKTERLVFSTDAGATWGPMGLPTGLTRIRCIAFSADGTLWLGGREGVYFTPDLGKTWMWIQRLPYRYVDDLYYDAAQNRMLGSSRSSEEVFSIDPKSQEWKHWETGYRIGLIRSAGDRLVAASLYDGVLVEPKPSGGVAGQR